MPKEKVNPVDAEEIPVPEKLTPNYKAEADFSWDGKPYKKGDAINVTDPVVIEKLLQRKQISKGKGKDQPTEVEALRESGAEVTSMKESVKGKK